MKNKRSEKPGQNQEITQQFVTQLYLLLLEETSKSEVCATQQLNTEQIEAKFGKVAAQIHEHTKQRRIIDIIDQNGTSITHAITWFPMLDSQADPLETQRVIIQNGGLIGKTFKASGFEIEKPELFSGIVKIPNWLKKKFDVKHNRAVFKTYQFVCVRNEIRTLYGVVTEIYSPKFKPAQRSIITKVKNITDNTNKFLFSQISNYLE